MLSFSILKCTVWLMTHKLWGVSSTWPKRAKWQLKKKNYGKIILENGDGGNRPNETAIEAWLLDYEKLMMNKDTTSQEAIYQVRSRIELYLFDWFSPYELIVEAQNINLRAITAFGSTSRRLQVSLSIRHLHRNLLLNEIIHLTFLVIGEFYDRVKMSSTKNQLDRSIMLWSDVHSREKS